MTEAAGPDRDRRLVAQRVRVAAAKAKVQEFLTLNLTLAEQVELIDDLYQHVRSDLRRKQQHQEARNP
jgi:hypothetical protein